MGGREVGNAAVYIYAWDGMVYICLLELASGGGEERRSVGFFSSVRESLDILSSR